MDASFSIPATEVTAVGTQIDTTKLSDGEHTLKVTNGKSTKEVTFIVDNKAPEIDLGVEDGSVLSGNLTFSPKVRSVYKELHADHETGAADNK